MSNNIRCLAITLNDTQCERKSEQNSDYCWQHKKILDQNFSNISVVMIPLIGEYLNNKECITMSLVSKIFKIKELYQNHKCDSIIVEPLENMNIESFQPHKTNFIKKINFLYSMIPKLQYLDANLKFFSTFRFQNSNDKYTRISEEIIDVINRIKIFEKLKYLSLEFNIKLYDGLVFETIFPICESFSGLNLKFLSIDLDLYIYQSLFILLRVLPNLKYLELHKNSFEDNTEYKTSEINLDTLSLLGNDIHNFEINLDTLSLLGNDIHNFEFKLKSFKNIKRLILYFIDIIIMEDLKNLENLIALKFRFYNNFTTKYNDYIQNLKYIPKTIKYLELEEEPADRESTTFYINLIITMPGLEYLYIKIDFLEYDVDQNMRLLNFILNSKKSNIKYLYFYYIRLNNIEFIDKFVKLLKNSKLISFGFEYLEYNKNLDFENFLNLKFKFNWNLKIKEIC